MSLNEAEEMDLDRHFWGSWGVSQWRSQQSNGASQWRSNSNFGQSVEFTGANAASQQRECINPSKWIINGGR